MDDAWLFKFTRFQFILQEIHPMWVGMCTIYGKKRTRQCRVKQIFLQPNLKLLNKIILSHGKYALFEVPETEKSKNTKSHFTLNNTSTRGAPKVSRYISWKMRFVFPSVFHDHDQWEQQLTEIRFEQFRTVSEGCR